VIFRRARDTFDRIIREEIDTPREVVAEAEEITRRSARGEEGRGQAARGREALGAGPEADQEVRGEARSAEERPVWKALLEEVDPLWFLVGFVATFIFVMLVGSEWI